ncbi:MAG: hypothetical protein A3H37_00600 [Candidatus Schekmanbacteria bacterium RIFCSPLOWO2_02_FULL_38_14]|uniref:histidine kinase n=1 Tax=Candidatus Schekmanbacteria bacterium RIFCSPLOWO2_12_FULL_38_15 TaxID=1817883 RepID=A0A1F7SNV2_9BACT|nr:MAG: hypothetical protein A3H37_00600 [Candidatus Schekmanbacteria bacterium RIFCSPLOWO2_02_FULL_38_14]OGL55451.1 MAG: hypothetical protein A3G31_01400 [Candidatus Schekmanbacteria bacterium RIFCSPLOWO2_12_FULL_38_15]
MKKNILWLRERVLSVSIRIKVMGIALGIVFLFALTIIFQIRESFEKELREELKTSGIFIAKEMTSRSSGFILTPNQFALNLLIKNIFENNENVEYAFILSSSNEILVHSFENGFPKELLAVNRVSPGSKFRVEMLDTEEGIITDVAVPLFGGKLGTVRVGMNEKHLRNKLNAITLQILIVTAIVSLLSIGAASLLTIVLTRPITNLVSFVNALGKGDFEQRARIWADDEIGKLSNAFNDMIQKLKNFKTELEFKEEMTSQLLKKVINAQEEERKRIARELHDQTSQSLTSLMIGLKILKSAKTLDEVTKRSDDLRELTSKTLEEVHDLAIQLRPTVLDDIGLDIALQKYVADYSMKFNIKVDYHSIGFDSFRLPTEIEIVIYRVVQEALANILKHSEARNACLLLENRGNLLKVIVEDNGKGFDVRKVMSSEIDGKLGLFGMQERINLISGDITIESTPGNGTNIYITVPIDKKLSYEKDKNTFS